MAVLMAVLMIGSAVTIRGPDVVAVAGVANAVPDVGDTIGTGVRGLAMVASAMPTGVAASVIRGRGDRGSSPPLKSRGDGSRGDAQASAAVGWTSGGVCRVGALTRIGSGSSENFNAHTTDVMMDGSISGDALFALVDLPTLTATRLVSFSSLSCSFGDCPSVDASSPPVPTRAGPAPFRPAGCLPSPNVPSAFASRKVLRFLALGLRTVSPSTSTLRPSGAVELLSPSDSVLSGSWAARWP